MKKPGWTIRRDRGCAVALEFKGWTVLHLNPGTVRNEENADDLAAALNAFGVVWPTADNTRSET